MVSEFYLESAVLTRGDLILKHNYQRWGVQTYISSGDEVQDYQVIYFRKLNSKVAKELTKTLKIFLHKYQITKTLIIGLGNSTILADSLGPQTTAKIVISKQDYNFLTASKVVLFNPEVVEQTGIQSFDLIKAVVSQRQPDSIIIIDSLCTPNVNQLGHLIEITDGGIIPGYYLKDNKEINAQTFNLPIISIGVPLIYKFNNQFLSFSNINQVITELSTFLAQVINQIFLS